MKLTDKHKEYIELRAGGRSIRYSAQAIGIAKASAQQWELKLKDAISTRKEAELSEVYDRYGISRIGLVCRYGDELEHIERVLGSRRVNQLTAADECVLSNERISTKKTTGRDLNGKPVDESTNGTRTIADYGYSGIPTAKLIDMKLKILDKLQALYIPMRDEAPNTSFSGDAVIFACVDYLEQVRNRTLEGEPARIEEKGIENLVKALELTSKERQAPCTPTLSV
jgi:hypothetical protein